MEDLDFLMVLHKETRTSINHFDQMMDNGRLRAFTAFGAITAVAAAIYKLTNGSRISIFGTNLTISALTELSCILIIIPLLIQNRLYHYWVYRSINSLIPLENKIYSIKKDLLPSKDCMITHSLTQIDEKVGCYWQNMAKSKLFYMDILVFCFILLASTLLFFVFNA